MNEIRNMIYFLKMQRGEIELISGFYLHPTPCSLYCRCLLLNKVKQIMK